MAKKKPAVSVVGRVHQKTGSLNQTYYDRKCKRQSPYAENRKELADRIWTHRREVAATMERLAQLLLETSAMKTELKRRCVIYDYDTKARAAKALGLDAQSLFEMSYENWKVVRERYESEGWS